MAKTIITARPHRGGYPLRATKIPETPQQIADEAYDAGSWGPPVVPLHMRAPDGLGAMDQERFRETIRRIRAHEDCDIIINCTSSGASKAHLPQTKSGWRTTGNCPGSKWALTTQAPSTGCLPASF